MTFKETTENLRAKMKAKISAEMSEDEMSEVNTFLSDLDELDNLHEKLVEENAKFKTTIVNMVVSQGNNEKPIAEDGEKTPKTMDQIIAEKLANKN